MKIVRKSQLKHITAT